MGWVVMERGPRGGMHRREWCERCKALHAVGVLCPEVRRLQRLTDRRIDRSMAERNAAEERRNTG